MSCKSWGCSHCSVFRRASAAELISGGIRRAFARGERLRLSTYSPPREGMLVEDLGSAWNQVRSTLKKKNLLREYVGIVELQQRGEPHLHVIATGEYIPQAELAIWAERAGFGEVTDIRAVRDDNPRDLTDYALKQLSHDLAGYVTKANTTLLSERATSDGTAKRKQIRPVRPSRGWYPGGFKAAEKVVLKDLAEMMGRDEEPKDEGPWCIFVKRSDGGISVLNSPKEVKQTGDSNVDSARASSATDAVMEKVAQADLGLEGSA